MERARDWREPVHRRGADLQSVVIVFERTGERRRRRPWCLVSQVFHTTQVQLAHGEPLVPPTCSPRTVAWPTRRPRKENRWSGARAISLYQSAFGKTQTIFDLLHRGVTRDFFLSAHFAFTNNSSWDTPVLHNGHPLHTVVGYWYRSAQRALPAAAVYRHRTHNPPYEFILYS